MFNNIPILSLITFIPLIGAIILMLTAAFVSDESGKAQIEKNAPRVAFAVSVAVFILSILLVMDFDPSTEYQ